MSDVGLTEHSIFALNKPIRPVARVEMLETHVLAEPAEQRQPVAEEDGDSRDDETLNEAGLEETLNRHSAVDIEVLRAAVAKRADNLPWLAGQ